MKTAIILSFTYSRNLYGESKISGLNGAKSDIKLALDFCIKKEIPYENITIITDVEPCKEAKKCKLKFTTFPTPEFVCRELAQFVENTSKGIEDNTDKSNIDLHEIFIYFSGHGSKIPIMIPEKREEQAIVLLDSTGGNTKFLTTRDIFDILFGRIEISNSGELQIPIYTKQTKVVNNRRVVYSSREYICVQLLKPIQSPEIVTGPYRSNYHSNRGLPSWSNVLFIVDACHSAHMTHFPYVYDHEQEQMIQNDLINPYKINVHDVPYCVCVSSCRIDSVTKSSSDGSQLTQILGNQIKNINNNLTISQLYHSFTNSSNSLFQSFLKKETLTPVITSTCKNSNLYVPFFKNISTLQIERVEK
jgi:hypothetical protein